MPRKFSNNGFGGHDTLTYCCATESEAWELLRCSKNSQCQGLRCKQQLLFLHGRRAELSRGSRPSRKWRARRFCNTKRHVSCQLRGCPRAESKSREVGHTPTRVFCPAHEGLRTTDGTRRGRSRSEGGGRRRRAGKTFRHSGVSASGLRRTCYFGSHQKSSCHTFPGR